MEAMSFSKPVITTRHVEIPRILDEVLVEENDVEGLAQAIDTVYRSESLRRRLGKANRRLAERVFSLRNVARRASLLERLARPDRTLERPAPPADYRRGGAARQVNVQPGARSAAEI
jgi:glycosyltransferase involved in cell wall biosynthesis